MTTSIPIAAPNPPLTPEEIVQALRALRAQMPAPPLAPATGGLRRRLAHVHPQFIQAAVNATDVSAALEQSLGRTADDLRLEMSTETRFTAVVDELRSFFHSADADNMVRRQRLGLAALQTYQIAQQLARDESNSRLATHISEMKRLNKFGRARRKTTPPQPSPVEPQKSI